MSVSDAEAVRASIHEPERFELVFERHHRFVWSYLARRGGRELADDLAGEVFVRAFAARADFDPDRGEVRAWLCGIAANLLRGRFRTQARAARAFEREARRRLADVEATIGGPEAALEGPAIRARLAAVVRALGELPSVDREVITLFVWEQLTYEEIAVVTGVAVGTVRSRLSRARHRLRELAGDAGEVNGDAHALEATDG